MKTNHKTSTISSNNGYTSIHQEHTIKFLVYNSLQLEKNTHAHTPFEKTHNLQLDNAI